MDFSLRPASIGWESLVLVPGTAIGMWVWCKPLHAPLDLIVRVPVETFQAFGGRLSLRQIALSAGAELAQVQGFTLQGAFIDGQGGVNPLLDHAVPPQTPWIEIAMRMQAGVTYPALGSVVAAAQAPVVSPSTPASTSGQAIAIEADWNAVLQMESQLMMLRKQLATIQGKLQTLNRDLNANENVAADNQDKREWQDTRRWLRDASSLASRYIKEADSGVTSMAGNKRRLEQLVEDARAGRLNPQQMASGQNEIESHRKTVLNIQNQMQNALQSASRDGEQRAQMVLSRIAAKVRNHNSKRS